MIIFICRWNLRTMRQVKNSFLLFIIIVVHCTGWFLQLRSTYTHIYRWINFEQIASQRIAHIYIRVKILNCVPSNWNEFDSVYCIEECFTINIWFWLIHSNVLSHFSFSIIYTHFHSYALTYNTHSTHYSTEYSEKYAFITLVTLKCANRI